MYIFSSYTLQKKWSNSYLGIFKTSKLNSVAERPHVTATPFMTAEQHFI